MAVEPRPALGESGGGAFSADPRPPGRIRCHDWPDKLGKGYWAWDTVRWVPPPKLEVLGKKEGL